jgi:undecaprenyl-diphosphatase
MRIAVLVAVALILAGIASPTLKLLFSRYRPNETLAGAFRLFAFAESDASFPSGHSMAAFALAGVLASAFPSRRGWIFGLAALIPLARVVGGRHFVSDAVAGIAVGLLAAMAAPRLVTWWRGRRAPTSSDGPRRHPG